MVFCGIGANYFVRMGRVGKSLANAFATPERLIVFDIKALTKFSRRPGNGMSTHQESEGPAAFGELSNAMAGARRGRCTRASAAPVGKLASDRRWGRIGFRVWFIPCVDNS
jgi:hypothetical protein